MAHDPLQNGERRNEPAINLPGVILWTIVLLIAVHLYRTMVLGPVADLELIARLAFVPDREGLSRALAPMAVSTGPGAYLVSLFGYGLLHGDWLHLGLNCVWLAAFGAPVGRRFGPMRTLILLLLGSVAGAGAHYLLDPSSVVPLVGASAAISAAMGAAGRFIFLPGGGMLIGPRAMWAPVMPARSLVDVLRDRRVQFFVLTWVGINLVVMLGLLPIGGADQMVAWEAHLGGFFAGFLMFGLIDRSEDAVALSRQASHDDHPERGE